MDLLGVLLGYHVNGAPAGSVVHVASLPVEFADDSGRTLTRQRCGWCGAMLVDADSSRRAVVSGDDGHVSTWPVGNLVSVAENQMVSWALRDGYRLPPEACLNLDPEVTR